MKTVSRMLTHLQTVLEELVIDPERRLSEISVLRSEQKQRLLFDWNQTSTGYEKDVCVHQLIERQATLRPTAIAAIFSAGLSPIRRPIISHIDRHDRAL